MTRYNIGCGTVCDMVRGMDTRYTIHDIRDDTGYDTRYAIHDILYLFYGRGCETR